MRTFTSGLAMAVLMLMARPALAQFGTMTTSSSPNATMTTSMPGFLRQTMTRPDIMAPVTRPAFPTPLSLPSLLPTLPNFQNVFLMRNIFGGSQQFQVLPPYKKK